MMDALRFGLRSSIVQTKIHVVYHCAPVYPLIRGTQTENRGCSEDLVTHTYIFSESLRLVLSGTHQNCVEVWFHENVITG